MAHIGFYSGINLIDTSSVISANLEFNRDRIMAEAQDLADECECAIDVSILANCATEHLNTRLAKLNVVLL